MLVAVNLPPGALSRFDSVLDLRLGRMEATSNFSEGCAFVPPGNAASIVPSAAMSVNLIRMPLGSVLSHAQKVTKLPNDFEDQLALFRSRPRNAERIFHQL